MSFDFSTAVLEKPANAGFDFATARPEPVAPEPSPVPEPIATPKWEPDGPAWQIARDPQTAALSVLIDPSRFSEGVKQAYEAGAIDKEQFESAAKDIEAFDKAVAARRKLEEEAGEMPELKAALAGLSKGSAQTAAGLAAFGTATTLAAETGPAAPVIGAVAAIPAAWGAGKAYDAILERVAKENEDFRSMLAARQLHPGFDTAGQLAFVAASIPQSGFNLYKGYQAVKAAKGADAAAKFLARTAAIGGGTGAAFDAGIQSLEKLVDKDAPGPTVESTLTGALLGVLSSGVTVGNRRYSPEDVRGIFAKAQRGDRLSPAEHDVMAEAAKSTAALGEELRATGRQPEPGTAQATVDQTTVAGRPVATRAEVSVRTSPTRLGKSDFDFATARPVGPDTPPKYTGQTFQTRQSPGPVRQPVSGDEGTLTLRSLAELPEIPPRPVAPPAAPPPVAQPQHPPPAAQPPQQPEPEPVVGGPKRTFSTAFAHSPLTPVISYIAEHGGIKPGGRQQRAGGEYDEQPTIRELAGFGRVVLGGSRPADLMAQDLYEAGLLSAPDASLMWETIRNEVASYRKQRKVEAEQSQVEKQAERFVKAAFQPSKGTNPLPVSELQVGDSVEIKGEKFRVKAIDPDTFSVTLEDGAKFGIQEVADGSIIYAEEHEMAKPEAGTPSDFVPEGYEPPEATHPAVRARDEEKFWKAALTTSQRSGATEGFRNARDQLNAVSATANAFREENAKRDLFIADRTKDGWPVLEVKTVQWPDGQVDMTFTSNLGNTGYGIPWTGAYDTLEAALADAKRQILDWLDHLEAGRSNFTEAEKRNISRIRKELATAKASTGPKVDNQGRDLEAVRRQVEREAETHRKGVQQAAQMNAARAANVPFADWTTVEGVEVLRSGNSRWVAVPRNGKRNAATFDTIDLETREPGPQLRRDEVREWLHRTAVAEFEQTTGQSVFTPPPAEPEPAPSSKLPTIETKGEGNLFGADEIEFNLAGEIDITPELEAAARAKREAEEARRKMDEDQTTMFDAPPPGTATATATKPKAKPGKGGTVRMPDAMADAPIVSRGPGWTMPETLGATEGLKPPELPEFVELVRQLGVELDVKKLPSANGLFYPVGAGKILLNTAIFRNPKSVLMTAWHEFGHLVDYMPDRTMNRGNILGRLAKLRGFLKHSIPLGGSPNPWPGPGEMGKALTPEERKKMAGEALAKLRESLGETVKRVIVQEPIYRVVGITPEDVKGLFGLDARDNLPELYQWFAAQDTATKVAIVKAAMRGIVDERVARFGRREQIGVREVEKIIRTPGREPKPDEIKRAIDNAIREEYRRRNRADLKLIRDELIALSRWWKPYDPRKSPPSYVKYRESAAELYADAISVLFCSPADLRERAPMFWETFWNYVDNNPEIKNGIFELQALLFKGQDAVNAARLDRMQASFARGDELFRRKMEEANSRGSFRGWWDSLKDQYYWRYQPAIEKQHELERRGVKLSAQDRMDWLFEEHPMGNNDVSRMMERMFNRAIVPLREAGLTEDDLGKFLYFNRIARERIEVEKKIGDEVVAIETGRAVLANPQGHNPETARAALQQMEKQLTEEQWQALNEAAAAFHDIVFDVMRQANAIGLISDELFENVIEPNRDAYATFTPLKYITAVRSSAIKRSRGTLDDIENPFLSTVLKMVAMQRAIQRNRATRGLVSFLRRNFPGEIKDATMRWNGRFREPVPPKDKELGMLTYLVDGKRRGVYVEKRLAEMFEDKSEAERDAVVGVLNGVWSGIVYPLIIKYNPVFQLFMSPARDLQRTLHHAPKGTRRRIALAFLREIRDAIANVLTGGRAPSTSASRLTTQFDDLMAEMIENYAIGAPHDSFLVSYDTSNGFAELMRKYHLLPEKERGKFLSSWVGKAIMRPLRAIQYAGQILEAAPKVATYRVLAKELGWDKREAAAYVRNHVGIPNYFKKGRKIGQAGVILPFLNIALRGWESSAKMAMGREGKRKTPADYWLWYLLAGGGMWTVLQTLAREGVFGEDLQRLYSRVSDYNMTNYLVLPVGETDTGDFGGKTAFIRFPQDEADRFLNGVLHKALTRVIRAMKGEEQTSAVADIWQVGAGYLPGVNPAIEVAAKWNSFLQGQNPLDTFRGNPILSNDEWMAGGWPAYRKMGLWTIDELGLGNFLRYDPEAKTLLEFSVGATPLLNRMLIISDAGLHEQQGTAEQLDDATLARLRVNAGPSVQTLRRAFSSLNRIDATRRTPAQADRFENLKIWYYKIYRPTMESVGTLVELGEDEMARELMRGLENESKEFIELTK